MNAENPLQPVVKHWLTKIRLAWDFKRDEFQNDADEAMRFFDGPYEFMYGLSRGQSGGFTYTGDPDRYPRTSFCMTVNKVAEMVQLFGPALYHRNPTRLVLPRKQPDVPPELFGDVADPMAMQMFQSVMMQAQQSQTMDQARANLLQHYLNYTPEALNLKSESRWAIDEAIIKGMGLLWTETYSPPGSGYKMVGSFFDSVDNLVMDPDADLMREAKWVARKCCHPVWEVEREYGLPPGSLRGTAESFAQQSSVAEDPELLYRRKEGKTADLLVYWKIYSRMGAGGRLSGVAPDLRETLEAFGDNVFLVVADGVPYPLNMPPQTMTGGPEVMLQATAWPTPFWADDAWPFAHFTFHERPKKLWPMSHLKPGLGELKFINWCYSFIAGKIRTTCRDFVAMKKSLGEEIKTTILSGQDLELMEIEEQHPGAISDYIMFLQHAPFNGDIWKVLEAVEASFEKRVGLTELMYGLSATQMRSAEEAAVKRDQIMVRPDDMANKVEEAMKDCGRREALAARWHLTGQDVAPLMGPLAGQLWDQLITVSDPRAVLYGLEYRIEAGSVRKPNVEGRIARMTTAMQTLFTPLWQLAMQTGNVLPVNALLEEWAKAHDFDVQKFLIPPPPMPAMPPAGGAEEGGAAEKTPAGVNGPA